MDPHGFVHHDDNLLIIDEIQRAPELLQAIKMDVDKRVMIAVLSIGDGIVGKCAKYVDDIASWGDEFYHTKIEWKRFTNEVYPFGIPVL
jgi:hypothetical protein